MKKAIIFIDIETVPQFKDFHLLPERQQELWKKKASLLKAEDPTEAYLQKAGIYAEFGKIITIALGIHFKDKDQKWHLRIRSITNHNEKNLLIDFIQLLQDKFDQTKIIFCAHNGKEFDYPYLCRRILINSLALPSCLQLAGKKPWEIAHIDTLEMWKFGDYKNYTSLETLATVFNIPTSKDDIDGSQVRDAYYEDNALNRIERYCQNDVIVTSQVYLKLTGKELVIENNIERISDETMS